MLGISSRLVLALRFVNLRDDIRQEDGAVEVNAYITGGIRHMCLDARMSRHLEDLISELSKKHGAGSLQ
jgi:hypothetical protein